MFSQIAAITLICIEVSVGLLCLYIALLLDEKEEATLQTAVQDSLHVLWKRIAKTQHTALSGVAVFIRVLAAILAKGIRAVFGPTMLSWRAAAVSLITTAGWMYAAMRFMHGLFVVGELKMSWFYEASLITLSPLLIAALPSRRLHQVLLAVATVAATPLAIFPAFFVLAITMGDGIRGIVLALLFLSTSVAANLLVFSTFRHIAEKAADRPDTTVLLLFVASVVGLGMLVIAPLWLAGMVPTDGTYPLMLGLSGAIFVAGSLPLLTLIIAILVIAPLLLIHRLFWPLLRRIVYAVHRHGLIRKRKLIVYCGLSLIVLAVPSTAPLIAWLKRLPLG